MIDCRDCDDLASHWVRTLVPIAKRMGERSLGVGVVTPSAVIQMSLRRDGVARLLPVFASARAWLVSVGLSPRGADVKFLNPFLSISASVISNCARVSAVAGQTYTRAHLQEESLMNDISGVVRLEADQFEGYVILSFPEKTLIAIMSRMLKEDFASASPEICGGAGELLNIIIAKARKQLNDGGLELRMALPRIVAGRSLPPELKGIPDRSLIVPFETELGPFYADIRLSA